MKIKRLYNRFKQVRLNYVGEGNLLHNMWFYWDYMVAFIIHGASINDYFAYGFYKLRYSGRKEYVTYRRYHKIQNICNPSVEERQKCRDKIVFNTCFSEYLGRKWLNFDSVSYEDFIKFINDAGDKVFVKAIDSYRGIGVQAYDTKDLDTMKLYDTLKDSRGTRFILEEKIKQTGELADFHKWSINTIRIITVYDTVHNKVNIVTANLRVGRNKDHRDNLHSGGIAANIDVETGIIFSPGFDQDNKLYLVHPDTGKQFIGFRIPYWEECKNYIREAAKNLPTVRYVGWDIVSKGDGTFALIEGNDNADHDIQQLNNRGLWKEYKELLKDISAK